MGSTSITVADELFTAASERIMKPDVLKSHRSVPTFVADDAFASAVTEDGGWELHIPNIFERHSTPTSFTFGTQYRTIDTFNQVMMKSGRDSWMFIGQGVFFGPIDENYYSSKDKQIDVVQQRTVDVQEDLRESFERAIIRGPATSGSWVPDAKVQQWAGINPLNGSDTFSPAGLIEAASSGSNTVHNLSRSTYGVTTYPRFHNVAAAVAGSASTNLLDRLTRMQTTFRQRGGDMSKVKIYGHPDAIDQLTKVLRPALQYATIKQGSEQYALAPLFGKDVVPVNLPDDGATTGGSASTKWSFLGVTWGKQGIAHVRHSKWNMKMLPWQTIPGTAGARLCMFLIQAQNLCMVPGNNFIVYGANAYS